MVITLNTPKNHIIPEIIDETGNVLPEGEYGELVLTTIGADAMPLIRYRTGDFTRILPPCKCGGITKRLDTVSRREGTVSIEELDSLLFRIPALADYRVHLNDQLRIEAYGNCASPDPIRAAVTALYPQLEVHISLLPVTPDLRPAYPGKRYVIIE